MEEQCRMGDVHMWGLEAMQVRRGLDSCFSVATFALAYGGFEFTSRLWGLALDAITSIDVVLVNGANTKIEPRPLLGTSKFLNSSLILTCLLISLPHINSNARTPEHDSKF
jgi:hypothetical protein